MELQQAKKTLYSKGTIIKVERQPTEWEKIISNHTSDKGLIYKICNISHNSTIKRQTICFKKWAEALNRYFSKEDIQVANRYIGCSTSLIIREMKIKITVRYHLTPTRMDITKNSNTPGKSTGVGCHCLLWLKRQEINTVEDVEEREPTTVGRTVAAA